MRTARGRSFAHSADVAIREATSSFGAIEPDLVLAFVSTKQDPVATYGALHERFPNALVVGCSTTGESLDGAHANGSLTVAALETPNVRWSTKVIEPLSRFSEPLAVQAVTDAFRDLAVDPTTLDASEVVGVLFSDGLSCKEERLAAAVADALEGFPLVGGSAGDDLAFERTWVLGPGGARSDAAVLLVGRGPAGFYRVVKHQHFTERRTSLAVTRADPARRVVYELDGYPAADAYARALGCTAAELTDDATLSNPVVVKVQGQLYVRSIQKVNADGSLTFYCAVDEGWILDLAGHHEMVPALEQDLAALRSAPPAFMLGFNCILRALEAEKHGLHPDIQRVLERAAAASVSFDTYGEVLNGLHINQTLVALALDDAA